MTERPATTRRWRAGDGGYWLYAAHLWAVFGIALSNLFLGLGLLASIGRLRRLEWGRYAPVLAPLALYVLALGGSIVASRDPAASLGEAREVLALATLPLALAVLGGTARVRRIVDGLAIVAAASSLHGLLQLLLNREWPLYRIQGPFSHYMTLAGFLLLADLLLMARIACDPAARRSLWRWAILVPINLAVVATLTRGAWVALFLGFTVLLLLRAPRYLAVFLSAVLVFVFLAPQPVRHRVLSTFNPHDVTNYDRLCMAEAGLRMIAHHPLTGLGPDMVSEFYPIYRHPTAPRQTVPHLHNATLQLTAERGLGALAGYLWLMGGALWIAYRSYRRAAAGGRDEAAGLYLGIVVALLAFNINGLFEDNWSDTEVQRVALFLVAVPHALGSARETIDSSPGPPSRDGSGEPD